ncbi:segregation and condensation protein A [Yinghuangia sp. YIM S10712]|uniref:segregation and condensation protein A n=1 Tax=Yinghuangia sp. YIM S10712 TaxID=3436930 RepID=UPI003F53A6F0
MSTPNPRPRPRRNLGRGGAFAVPAQTGEPEAEQRPETPAAAGPPTASAPAPAAEEAPTTGGEDEPESIGGASPANDRAARGTSRGTTAAAATDGPDGPDGPDEGDAAVSLLTGAAASPGPAEPVTGSARHDGFAVRLDNFEGPFDLLLSLIAKHKLDVTEVSLSKVTDEFIAYIRAQGPDWDLGVATEFLVVAATLLDLKAARLLPVAEIEDEEDLALLEARDLLFARLLQYRAYKEIAAIFDECWAVEGRRYPRDVPLEERYTGMLPELVLDVDPEKFARLAARAMTPKSPKVVSIEHIHVPRVSVREQSAIVVERLRAHGALTFRALIADCPDNLHVIARFLCLLELFREAAVGFDQVEALGELHVRWTGGEEDAPEVGAEFDEQDGTDGRTDTTGADDVEESQE